MNTPGAEIVLFADNEINSRPFIKTELNLDDPINFSVQIHTPKLFMKANSKPELTDKPLMKTDTLRGSLGDPADEDFGPLSNVRFAVFALGSSTYPNFCAFGKYVDNLLGELGGERLMKLEQGDEMCGLDNAFKKWATEVFRVCIQVELYFYFEKISIQIYSDIYRCPAKPSAWTTWY